MRLFAGRAFGEDAQLGQGGHYFGLGSRLDDHRGGADGLTQKTPGFGGAQFVEHFGPGYLQDDQVLNMGFGAVLFPALEAFTKGGGSGAEACLRSRPSRCSAFRLCSLARFRDPAVTR